MSVSHTSDPSIENVPKLERHLNASAIPVDLRKEAFHLHYLELIALTVHGRYVLDKVGVRKL
jgi:hypothetical protein